MTEEKPKPIPLTTYVVTTYVCPICNHDIFVNLEEAKKHVAMPVDTPLPVGLIFKGGFFKSDNNLFIITDSSSFVSSRDHGYHYCQRGFPRRTSYEDVIMFHHTSKTFKEELRYQPEMLMTEKEFEDFKKKYEAFMGNNEEKRERHFEGLKAENLIRTTPELEAIVAEGKLAREIMYKAGLKNREEEDSFAREIYIMHKAELHERGEGE